MTYYRISSFLRARSSQKCANNGAYVSDFKSGWLADEERRVRAGTGYSRYHHESRAGFGIRMRARPARRSLQATPRSGHRYRRHTEFQCLAASKSHLVLVAIKASRKRSDLRVPRLFNPHAVASIPHVGPGEFCRPIPKALVKILQQSSLRLVTAR